MKPANLLEENLQAAFADLIEDSLQVSTEAVMGAERGKLDVLNATSPA